MNNSKSIGNLVGDFPKGQKVKIVEFQLLIRYRGHLPVQSFQGGIADAASGTVFKNQNRC